MADFLTRLVGRTLGTIPTVKPVLTPMFALQTNTSAYEGESTNNPASSRPIAASPARNTSIIPSASERFIEQTQDGQAQGTAPTVQIPDLPVSQTMPHTDLPMPFVSQPDHVEIEFAPPTPIKSSEDIVSVGTGQAQDNSSTSYTRFDRWTPAEQIDRDMPLAGFRIGTSPVSTVQHFVGSDEQAPILSPVSVNRISPSIEHNANMSIPEISDNPGIQPLLIATPQRRSRVSLHPVDHEHGGNFRTADPLRSPHSNLQGRTVTDYIESASPTSEPTIQVTIGRIEVRATPLTPAAAPVQRKKPAIMGLEEYLDQRAKGVR